MGKKSIILQQPPEIILSVSFDFDSWDLLLYFSTMKKGKQGIASLQPPSLAQFPAWGCEEGADRSRLPGAKVVFKKVFANALLEI